MYGQVKAYSVRKKSRIMDLEKCVLTSKNGASCLRGTPGYCTDTKLSQTKRKNVMRRQTDSLK